MYIELKNLTNRQRATFKPDHEQTWSEFLRELQSLLQEIGIPEGSLNCLTAFNNGPEVVKMFATYDLPLETLEIKVKKPVLHITIGKGGNDV